VGLLLNASRPIEATTPFFLWRAIFERLLEREMERAREREGENERG